MKQRAKNIFACPNPNGNGLHISYELGKSRKVHQVCTNTSTGEKPPHGAGSFHDPDQHQHLMKRVTDYIKETQYE